MSARQQRIGGGRTNKGLTVDVGEVLSPSHAIARPFTSSNKVGNEPAHRPTTSHARREFRGGTGTPLRSERGSSSPALLSGDRYGEAPRSNLSSRSNSSRRDALFGATVTLNTNNNTYKAPPTQSQQSHDGRPRSGASTSSTTSSVLQAKVVDFQKSFQKKNITKYASLAEAFRTVDANKNGLLGRDELRDAMVKVGMRVDERVIDRLFDSMHSGKNGMDFQDFRDLLWIDDRMSMMFNEGNKMEGAGGGDHARQTHLWTRTPKNPLKFVGTLNDTLEADRIRDNKVKPSLDMNFSGVQYDILNLDEHRQQPLVPIPVRNRARLFDPPNPLGRRVAYDHGDSPYNVVSLRTPRLAPEQNDYKSGFQVPVRVLTFSRIHGGQYPTQQAHMLARTVV